jgi:hypothetical protein
MIGATFHGPNHFVPNHDESTIEVFENIGHAISALFDRYDKGERWPQPVHYLNGNHGDILFPLVEVGDYFDCYRIDSLDGSTPPGDEAIEDALTAVHGGLRDYRLTLMRPFGAMDNGTISVSVEKG